MFLRSISGLLVVLAACGLSPSPSPTPTALPAPTPTPAISVGGDFTASGFHTAGVNPGDTASTGYLSNLLLNISAGVGKVRVSATVGDYAFPTVGQLVASDSQATALYTALPLAAIQYAPNGHLSFAIGKFAALLGQESPFTFQNLNIQRGLGWAIEPTISRGVQAAYTTGAWSATLQENDAYYSGSHRAFEGLVGWAPSANTDVQFAAILTGANVPSNPTASIGNKSEYDLMYARHIGKLQLLPYVLLAHSPASAPLGYTRSENATAAVLLAAWTFSPAWTLAFRYENLRNSSSTGDASPNADLIGYGPGSGARTLTLTPTWSFGYNGVVRLEYSHVAITAPATGLGFGATGNGTTQNRYGLEFGVMH